MSKANKKQEAVSLISDYGKLPPQSRELEQSVLGALMLEKNAFFTIENIISSKDFYDSVNAEIFQCISNLANDNHPIDMLTVVEQLRKDGQLEAIGGPVYIAELTDRIGSTAHIDYHARIIKQKSAARDLISFSNTLSSMAYDETNDVADIMEFAEKGVTDISSIKSIENVVLDMRQAVKQAVESISQEQTDRLSGKVRAIPTGLTDLDKKLFGGWKAPDLIVIGGRPGMGKTQFALLFGKSSGNSKKDCLMISIEMTSIQLINRYLLENEEIDDYRLETGQLNPYEWEMLDQRAKELSELNMYIADHHSICYLNNIKSLARKMHRAGKLKLMIIDYLGLIETGMKFGTRDQEIGYITKSLKNLCKELNIPIILLAQLSRPPKGVNVLPPKLDDLRESGNIEQDADIVIFPHRPTYYEQKDATADEIKKWENRGGLIIAKHRKGVKDAKVYFKHDKRFKKIFDDEDHESNQFPTSTNNHLPF